MVIKHTLPGKGGETLWFERLNSFEQKETKRQAEYKSKHWPELPDGCWSEKPGYMYPHILPADERKKDLHLEKNFYPPIAAHVLGYCEREKIAIHSEALNLRSSQVCCFNVMFPFRLDLGLATLALSPVLPGVRDVTSVEFEYTGPPEATEWLKEPSSGQRGQNRTSIDVAIRWKGGNGDCLTFVEWKYTESTFGTCGGFKSKGNKDKKRCENLIAAAEGASRDCYLTQGRHKRQYWEHLAEAGVNLQAFQGMKGCPFMGPFYQLMRQYLLAAFLRKTGDVKEVFVTSLGFKGNWALHKMPSRQMGLGPDVIDSWNKCLTNVPPLHHVDVEDVVACVKAASKAEDRQWLSYLNDRYGL